MILEEISEYRKGPTAIKVADGYTAGPNGNKHPKKTTCGWELNTQMKEGPSQWIPLKDLNEGNLFELSEYAVADKIDHEPVFEWWVPFTLRKWNRIISKLQKKYLRTTQKFGIEVLRTVKRAYEIGKETGTELWRKAIAKEMIKVKVA